MANPWEELEDHSVDGDNGEKECRKSERWLTFENYRIHREHNPQSCDDELTQIIRKMEEDTFGYSEIDPVIVIKIYEVSKNKSLRDSNDKW